MPLTQISPSTSVTRVLAQAKPMGSASVSANSRSTGNHVHTSVISVGPYMLTKRVSGQARRQALSVLQGMTSPQKNTRSSGGAQRSSAPAFIAAVSADGTQKMVSMRSSRRY